MESTDVDKREAIHKVLARLEEEGRLTPDNVIEEAKTRDSPLHDEFTWDLKAAAMMTWRSQARSLISQFQITYTIHRTEYRVQEFVEAPGKAEREQGYVAFTRIKSQKQLAREFLDRELGIASTYVSKCTDFARVLGLDKRVATVVDQITTLRREVQPKATKAARASAP